MNNRRLPARKKNKSTTEATLIFSPLRILRPQRKPAGFDLSEPRKPGEVRSGQVKAPNGFTYWLLKFDGMEGGTIKDNPMGIGRIEFTYYQMALACGIEMMESRLLEEGTQAHFMTKRFDRTDNGIGLNGIR